MLDRVGRRLPLQSYCEGPNSPSTAPVTRLITSTYLRSPASRGPLAGALLQAMRLLPDCAASSHFWLPLASSQFLSKLRWLPSGHSPFNRARFVEVGISVDLPAICRRYIHDRHEESTHLVKAIGWHRWCQTHDTLLSKACLYGETL